MIILSADASTLGDGFDPPKVLLDLASEQYFGLNDVGTRVWQILTEHGNPNRAVEILLEEYDVDEKTLREDVAYARHVTVDASKTHLDTFSAVAGGDPAACPGTRRYRALVRPIQSPKLKSLPATAPAAHPGHAEFAQDSPTSRRRRPIRNTQP